MSTQAMIDKIRAMLAKTVENGCTEAEAMVALQMAETMMQAHEITEDDLKEVRGETAILMRSDMRDPQNVRWKLCYWISKFTETKTFGHKKSIKFVGLKGDVEFALWLTETLTTFVHSELKRYMWANGYQAFQGTKRVRVINSFIIGCCSRINTKLLTMINARNVTTLGTDLVVAKQALIEDVMKDLNVKKADNRGRKASAFYRDVYSAGQEAGDKASFGRPVEDKQGMLRIGK